MKEIIKRFADKHKNSKFYISYCDFEDFDAYAETNYRHRHLIFCNKRDDLSIIESDHALINIFRECTDQIEFDGVTYRHKLIERDDQFILMMNVETGEFVTKGHVSHTSISAALDRISITVDALMFYESQKDKGTNYLNSTYPWLGFSWHREDEFHIGGRYSNVSGFFILYENGLWEIDCSLDKQTIRSMKRHLPKKIRHRRNRQIDRVKARMESKELTSFERLLINAKTGPVKKNDLDLLSVM